MDSAIASPKTTPSNGIVVGGARNMLVDFCKACNPVQGEDIKAVVTKGRGFKIHRLGCPYILQADMERTMDAAWDLQLKSVARIVRLEVVFEDAPGMLATMSGAISTVQVNIQSVDLRTLSHGKGLARFGILLSTIDELNNVVLQLEQTADVISVKRI